MLLGWEKERNLHHPAKSDRSLPLKPSNLRLWEFAFICLPLRVITYTVAGVGLTRWKLDIAKWVGSSLKRCEPSQNSSHNVELRLV